MFSRLNQHLFYAVGGGEVVAISLSLSIECGPQNNDFGHVAAPRESILIKNGLMP